MLPSRHRPLAGQDDLSLTDHAPCVDDRNFPAKYCRCSLASCPGAAYTMDMDILLPKMTIHSESTGQSPSIENWKSHSHLSRPACQHRNESVCRLERTLAKTSHASDPVFDKAFIKISRRQATKSQR